MNFTIPVEIDNSEEIVRVLIDPIHINKNKEVKPYAFQPPKNSEDISVNRLLYSSLDMCKKQGLNMQKDNKLFWGLGIVKASIIRDIGFSIDYTPDILNDNLAHSDIKIGEIKIENEPLSPNTTLKIKQLISKLNILTDPCPKETYWTRP